MLQSNNQINKLSAKCKQCGRELAPGEGERWTELNPHWIKTNGGGYLCLECRPIWEAWLELQPGLIEDLTRCRLWIVVNVAGAPVSWMQNGYPTTMDQRAAVQDVLHEAVYMGTGLGGRAVAKAIADFFEILPDRERELSEWIELVVNEKSRTIGRIEQKMMIPGRSIPCNPRP